jgi:hypothetical protein
MEKVANLLDVEVRTVRNWENGSTRIPYSAFRIVRMQAGYSLVGEGWEDWGFSNGKLHSPSGRSFLPYELHFISHYIAIARLSIESRNSINPDVASHDRAIARTSEAPLNPVNAHIERGHASGATAPSGARRAHDDVVIAVEFGQQRKTMRRAPGHPMFARFGAYSKAAANEALYYG